METVIKSREFDVSSNFKEIIFKKTSKIQRHYPSAKKLEVEIYQEHNPSISNPTAVELTLSIKKQLMRAECHGENLITALDKAVYKINRQIEKHKDRVYRSRNNTPKMEI